MRRFWLGFLLGVVSTVVALTAVFAVLTGPRLAASLDFPSEIFVGQDFSMTVVLSNPHQESVVFDNLDIPDGFFEVFEIVSVSPSASSGSPIGGFGSKTWYYDRALDPGGTYDVVLVLRPLAAGTHPIEMDVCNSYEDCTSLVTAVTVAARP